MKVHIFVLLIGIILGGLVAVPVTVMASSGSLPFMASVNGQAQEGQDGQGHSPESGETHQRMHQMMDAMHGEGFSQRMHEAMPESEEMMEQCASMKDMMGNMDGMTGKSGMMNGMMGHTDANP